MYPCSNPELVAAVSEAGGLGVVQPISLIYAHGYELREGLREIRALTDKPIAFNALVEQSSAKYEQRMRAWVDVAIEEGVRFFITAMGKPDWVVEKVHSVGGVVYHKVTDRRFAERALRGGVDGLIAVNDRAGGHAGGASPAALLEQLKGLGVPVIAAGGVGDEEALLNLRDLGYEGVLMGTRFIATEECSAHADYKSAILAADEPDVVLTDLISGVPVAIIATDYIKKVGTKAGWLLGSMLRHRKLKHYARLFLTLRAGWQLRQANAQGMSYKDFFQAGKSVGGVHQVEPAGDVVRRFGAAWRG